MITQHPMTRDEIDAIVQEILYTEGPDQHVDGHEVITAFIEALLTGHGRQWAEARYGDSWKEETTNV